MKKTIHINMYATLKVYTPDNSDKYPIVPGSTVRMLLEKLKLPMDQVKLIFVNSKKADMNSVLQGGEKVGIFPAVGGG